MGDTFVNLKMDGDPWNGAPPTALVKPRVMALRMPLLGNESAEPVAFQFKTLPSAGEGNICRLEILEVVTVVGGTASAKALAKDLRQAARVLIDPKNQSGNHIKLEFNLTALFADFFNCAKPMPWQKGEAREGAKSESTAKPKTAKAKADQKIKSVKAVKKTRK
jgi:hypothetical protein